MQTIDEKIKTVIQDSLEIDSARITNNAHLISDLGADELDVVNIVMKIENRLSINLESDTFDLTVGGLLELVKSASPREKQNILEKPRELHYLFAHKLLPKFLFSQGINVFADLRYKRSQDYMPNSAMIAGLDFYGQPIKDGLDYLYDLWDRLASKLKNNYISHDGLDYKILRKSNKLIIIFVFPRPVAMGEAYCSLFIWDSLVPQARSVPEQIEKSARYFTLEIGSNRTIIGQWLYSGTHVNLGKYESNLTSKQFLDTVLKRFYH